LKRHNLKLNHDTDVKNALKRRYCWQEQDSLKMFYLHQ